jgi:hypothetical protein
MTCMTTSFCSILWEILSLPWIPNIFLAYVVLCLVLFKRHITCERFSQVSYHRYNRNSLTLRNRLVTHFLPFLPAQFLESNIFSGHQTTQAVSRRLSTAAVRVRSQVRSCRICGGQSGNGVGFLLTFCFPLPILIPPNASYSSFGAGAIG